MTSAANAPGYTVWINGKRYDDRVEAMTVSDLRRLAEIPDDHDLFVESAAWDDTEPRKLNLLHVEGGQDVNLDDPYRTIHLSVHRRFFSTPRYINAS